MRVNFSDFLTHNSFTMISLGATFYQLSKLFQLRLLKTTAFVVTSNYSIFFKPVLFLNVFAMTCIQSRTAVDKILFWNTNSYFFPSYALIDTVIQKISFQNLINSETTIHREFLPKTLLISYLISIAPHLLFIYIINKSNL